MNLVFFSLIKKSLLNKTSSEFLRNVSALLPEKLIASWIKTKRA